MSNALIGFIFGTILGSFVDCISNRSLTKKSFFGRSFCDSCKKTLAWFDLIPIFSYIFLKGKCRFCKVKITSESILVEVLMGLLIALLFYLMLPELLSQTTFNWALGFKILDTLFYCFVICVLVSVFITDIKTGLIPDRITYPSIVIAFIYLLLTSVAKVALLYYSLTHSVLGKLLIPPHSDYFYRHAFYTITPFLTAVLASFLLGGAFFLLIVLTKGRGMGGGDFKLAIFLGLVFNIPNSLMVLMLSFLTGSIAGVALLLFGKKKFGQTIPFGPFLSLGSLATLYWGDKLINWYLNFRI